MNLSLCRFLDTLPPFAVFREEDQSAYGRASSFWVSLLKARELQMFSKQRKGHPPPLKNDDYAKEFVSQEGGKFVSHREHR